MKNVKKHTKNAYDDYDDDEDRNNLKKSNTNSSLSEKRRPIKNWTKVWSEHADEADEYDEFYAKK